MVGKCGRIYLFRFSKNERTLCIVYLTKIKGVIQTHRRNPDILNNNSELNSLFKSSSLKLFLLISFMIKH